MKIMPFMSRGIAFMLPDGSVAMLPLHIFRSAKSTVVRIGNNALFFNEDGTFDGEEFRISGGIEAGEERASAVESNLKMSADNQGAEPDDYYFEEGSPGHDAEVRSRSVLVTLPSGPSKHVYTSMPKKQKKMN